ncbi:MAG: heavy metal-responsive transcriptional regulator [Candidatus Zixiibacteriota bacterium]
MLIGKVAQAAGVNIQTLRYYERRGLVRSPVRRSSGYREYPPDAVDRIRFVKRSQELGLTLAEIGELLRLRESQRARCSDVRHRTQLKIAEIDNKIRSLTAMRSALAVLLRSCSSNATVRYCPIIESLEPIS